MAHYLDSKDVIKSLAFPAPLPTRQPPTPPPSHVPAVAFIAETQRDRAEKPSALVQHPSSQQVTENPLCSRNPRSVKFKR